LKIFILQGSVATLIVGSYVAGSYDSFVAHFPQIV